MVESKEYVVLPRAGFFHPALRNRNLKLALGRDVKVIHSFRADGSKVLKLDGRKLKEAKQHPHFRALPVVLYNRPRLLLSRNPGLPRPFLPKSADATITIILTEKKKGKIVPAEGFLVAAYSDFKRNWGDERVTDASGRATLTVLGDRPIERLYCDELWGWGAFRRNIPLHSPIPLQLEPLSANFTDGLRQYYKKSRFDPTTGVTVGVIDSGVGPHVDLNIIGGYNLTRVGPRDDYEDKYGHGTFVAGLIGSKGKRYPKLRGLAPGVRIQAYRVFGGGFCCQATPEAFHDAMGQAAEDGCDILNLSIEDGSSDDCLKHAITDARDQGMLVVVAAGNDDRKAVNYPAAYPGAIAVSAMGCEGTFPRSASDEAMVERPPRGKNPKEFIAAFSNCGFPISATGLGIGVLSTLYKNRYGECCGTSMAAPVVVGAAASLLSQNPDIYNMPRNRARSEAIEKLLLVNCIKRGFGPEYEGFGMPDPAKV